MELVILISLLVLGVILIVVEIIFIPGTTFIGVIGFVCLVVGIFSTYSTHGNTMGNVVLLGTGLFLVASLIYIVKAKTWEKMALNKVIDSRVNEKNKEIEVGATAIAVSDLKPFGTIEIENKQMEATTNGEFIENKSSVRVIYCDKNEIIVEKII